MLRLRRDLLDAMVAHCHAEHPLEACGVLAGRGGLAERHIPMRNAEASRTRYAMDPDEQVAVWREMDERGEQPVVIYHSHTATEARPSTPDVRYAAEPDAHYVIVSTRDEMAEVRSYRIRDGVVIEEPLEAVDEPGLSIGVGPLAAAPDVFADEIRRAVRSTRRAAR
jgi:proteasome lid subunit RPN8/RPN11